MSTYTIEMLHGRICIRDNLYTGEIQEQYIAEKGEKAYFICPEKGRFPGKRVFLGGGGGGGGAMYFQENGAWRAFGASVLNKFEFLTMYHLYTITHQCLHTRLSCYTGEFVYGIICIRERFRNSIKPPYSKCDICDIIRLSFNTLFRAFSLFMDCYVYGKDSGTVYIRNKSNLIYLRFIP